MTSRSILKSKPKIINKQILLSKASETTNISYTTREQNPVNTTVNLRNLKNSFSEKNYNNFSVNLSKKLSKKEQNNKRMVLIKKFSNRLSSSKKNSKSPNKDKVYEHKGRLLDKRLICLYKDQDKMKKELEQMKHDNSISLPDLNLYQYHSRAINIMKPCLNQHNFKVLTHTFSVIRIKSNYPPMKHNVEYKRLKEIEYLNKLDLPEKLVRKFFKYQKMFDHLKEDE